MANKNEHKYCFASPVSLWHKWFAWFPVRTWDNRLIWLKQVERRMLAKHSHLSGPSSEWFEYHYDKGYS